MPLKTAAADRLVTGAAFLVVLLAACLVAAIPIYADAVAESSLRARLARVPVEDANVQLVVDVFGGRRRERPRPARARARPRHIRRRPRDDVRERRVRAVPRRAGHDRIRFHRRPPAHAELEAGRWPATRASPVEVALPSAVASDLGLRVGDVFDAQSRLDPTHHVAVRVVGTYRPERIASAFWWGDPLATAGAGPFVTTRESFDALGLRDQSLRWRLEPDTARLTLDQAGAVRRRLASLPTRLNEGRPAGQQFDVQTNLPGVLDEADHSLHLARAGVLVPFIQLALLAAYGLIVTTALLLERRYRVTETLRLRGGTALQITALALVEATLIAVPAVALAPWLAAGSLRALNHVGPLADVGVHARAARHGHRVPACRSSGRSLHPRARASRSAGAAGLGRTPAAPARPRGARPARAPRPSRRGARIARLLAAASVPRDTRLAPGKPRHRPVPRGRSGLPPARGSPALAEGGPARGCARRAVHARVARGRLGARLLAARAPPPCLLALGAPPRARGRDRSLRDDVREHLAPLPDRAGPTRRRRRRAGRAVGRRGGAPTHGARLQLRAAGGRDGAAGGERHVRRRQHRNRDGHVPRARRPPCAVRRTRPRRLRRAPARRAAPAARRRPQRGRVSRAARKADAPRAVGSSLVRAVAPGRSPRRRVRRHALARPLPTGRRRAVVLVPAPPVRRQNGQARGGARRPPPWRPDRHAAISTLGRRHRGRRGGALPRLPSGDTRRRVARGRLRGGRPVASGPADLGLAGGRVGLRLPVPRASRHGGATADRRAARGASHRLERHHGEHRWGLLPDGAATGRPVLPAPRAERAAAGVARSRERRISLRDEHGGRRDGPARAVRRHPARAHRRQLPPLPHPRPRDARRRRRPPHLSRIDVRGRPRPPPTLGVVARDASRPQRRGAPARRRRSGASRSSRGASRSGRCWTTPWRSA